jgi:hypothetical protein
MVMAEAIKDKIKRSLMAADGLYHRLVLLVGETGSGKTGILHEVADDIGAKVINVNLMLSADLLELTGKQRALRLPEMLDRVTDEEKSTVVLDNLEILFDKDLKQDPLRLLQGISRNHSVVASWNGTATEGKLIYAEIGHPEYRSYDLLDTLIVRTDGAATVDKAEIIGEAGAA